MNPVLSQMRIAITFCFPTLDAFKDPDQVKRIKNTLHKYKRIDMQVEENQRLRELINSCQASLDKYNKKSGTPIDEKLTLVETSGGFVS